MSVQGTIQWLLVILLASMLFLAFTGMFISTLLITFSAEGLAFLFGFLGALVFANKLLFGYGSFVITAEAFLANKEIDRRKLVKKTKEPEERTQNLSIPSLLMLWLQSLDYYRYAYYGLFTLMLILMLLSKFNLLGALIIGNYLEGAFWGASVVTFFVFALELTAKYLMDRIIEEVVL
ncbi:MAG: hypothetical protein DSY42_07550 [Aquifex sp.]|nr:MAG: hypothetical protein DSY42_07550 [Aquifex sp.]